MSCPDCRRLQEAEAELEGLKVIFCVFYQVLTPEQAALMREAVGRIDQGPEEKTG